MTDLYYTPEGATPIEDMSDLKLPWIVTRKEQNIVEAENILQAFSKYFARQLKDSQRRKEYIAALKEADKGNYSSLIDSTQSYRER